MKSDTASANGSLEAERGVRVANLSDTVLAVTVTTTAPAVTSIVVEVALVPAPALHMMMATTGPIAASVRKKDAPAVDLAAASLLNLMRMNDLITFFEKAGPVKDAQIVKDRVSGRSKGVGYVEFKNEEPVSTTFLACTRDKSLDLRSKA
ncbi:hypothetical protein PENPOL_c017G06301 [Penicillium polonicum]|uniref:RRM domain-containing protein n=1 Tax=Penicillium polonicum TaxID=60169 RepID=A0A1V6N9Z6_PENPO|nr:hypothetical protein PENPOL_c017G06301 [Penicillium polonicum]